MKKTILITGASLGIGSEIAMVLAKQDHQIIINYNSHQKEAEDIKDLINKKGVKAIAIKADVSKQDEVIKMFEMAKQTFGCVDILINNAGVSQQKLFIDITEDQWDHVFNINIKGVYNCAKVALPDMIRAKKGRIINISSVWGMVGASCEVAYSASKAAVIGFTKALAKEVGPSGIQVNCVAPGVIATQMLSDLSDQDLKDLKDETPLGKIGSAKDVAYVVDFLVSDKSDFITGQIISPNGGFVI